MAEQLTLDLFIDERNILTDEKNIGVEPNPVDALFEPNAHRRCPHCRRRLHPIGSTGRLICIAVGCTGVA
jgi:hypothetical protein